LFCGIAEVYFSASRIFNTSIWSGEKMAGFSRIYCIGGLGGYMGSDGIHPIVLQIWVGEGNRQWFEAHYFDDSVKPMGTITTVIPEGPDAPSALLDACLAFYPDHFSDCPSLKKVISQLKSADTIDFDGQANVPADWPKLRGEAYDRFRELNIFDAQLIQLDLDEKLDDPESDDLDDDDEEDDEDDEEFKEVR